MSGYTMTKDVFDILQKHPERVQNFALCFGVGAEVVEKAQADFAKKESEAQAAKAKATRISKKVEKFDAFTKDKVNGFTLNNSTIELCKSVEALAEELSDDDGKVILGIELIKVDGTWRPSLSAKGFSTGKSSKSSGTRTKYQYFDSGTVIEGRLKGYINSNFPESKAVAIMKAYDNGEKKGSIGAWEAIQKDDVLKARITRTEASE